MNLAPGLHSVLMYYTEGSAGGNGAYSLSYQGADQGTMGLIPAARLFQSAPVSLTNAIDVTTNGGGIDVVGNIPGLNLGDLSIGQMGSTDFAVTSVSGRRVNFATTTLVDSSAIVNFTNDQFVGLGRVLDGANTNNTLTKLGNGQLILDNTAAAPNANDLNGTTLQLDAGKLVNMGSGAAGSTSPLNGSPLIRINGGTLTLDSKVNSYTFTNPITVQASGVVEVVPGNSTFSAQHGRHDD